MNLDFFLFFSVQIRIHDIGLRNIATTSPLDNFKNLFIGLPISFSSDPFSGSLFL